MAEIEAQDDSLQYYLLRFPESADTEAFEKYAQEINSLSIPNALQISNLVYQHFAKHGGNSSRTFSALLLSQIYSRDKKFADALEYHLIAIEYAQRTGNTALLAYAQESTAQFFQNNQILHQALYYYYQASENYSKALMDVKSNQIFHQTASIHYRVLNYADGLDDVEVVVAYYNLKTTENLPEQELFIYKNALNLQGLLLHRLGRLDEALDSYFKAEQLSRKLKDEFGTALINGNRGMVYKSKKQYTMAIDALQEDVRVSVKFKQFQSAFNAAVSLADIFFTLSRPKLTEAWLDSASLYIRRGGFLPDYRYWTIMATYQEYLGNTSKVIHALKKYISTRDSLYALQSELSVSRVASQFDLESKQAEINRLTRERELQEFSAANLRNAIIAISVIVFLLIVLVILLRKNLKVKRHNLNLLSIQRDEIEAKNEELKAQSQELKEKNDLINKINESLEQRVNERTKELHKAINELDTFLYRASHDIRRPITTILGVDNLARLTVRDEQARMLISNIAKTASHMDRMLYKLNMAYELNRLEAPEQKRVNLKSLIQEILLSYQIEISSKGIKVNNHVSDDIELTIAYRFLYIVLLNLIENALLFIRPGDMCEHTVTINAKMLENRLEVFVADNGTGIKDEFLDNVFDLYFRATEISNGNGLGLYLVKKALEKLGGQIRINNKYGEGTSFTFEIPVKTETTKEFV